LEKTPKNIINICDVLPPAPEEHDIGRKISQSDIQLRRSAIWPGKYFAPPELGAEPWIISTNSLTPLGQASRFVIASFATPLRP
jgi:hypothetical protein